MARERPAPDARWNTWVEAAGDEGDFLQTGFWAELDDELNERRSFTIGPVEGVGALVSHPSRGGGELVCLNGPVLAGGLGSAALGELVGELEAAARECGCEGVRVAGRPPLSSVPVSGIEPAFSSAGFTATAWWTSIVSLRRDDDALLGSFDRSVRKAIRRCRSESVTVLACSDADTVEQRFLAAYGEATGGHDATRGRRSFEIDGGRHYAYYVAVDSDGAVLATLGTYRFGGVAREIMSSRTPAGIAAGVPAQDLLHWEVMRRHRDLGDSWFDLAGYADEPSNDKEAGIRRFKEKWRGLPVPSPTYAKRIRRPVRRVARRLLGRA